MIFSAHHRKGLVDFEQIDIVQREPGLGQHLARRRDGRIQHQRRRVAHIRHRDDAGTRLQAMCPGIVRRRQQDRRGAVDHARRIAGVVHEIDIQIGIFLQNQVAIGRALSSSG
jgi:hypothetical protein